MIEIELNNIKKNFGLKNILNGFSLEIKTGERVALIGQNGSGKSTILKIIYENEKEDTLVKDFLYESFSNIIEIEQKLKNIEEKMSNEKNNDLLEKLIEQYGKIQEKYITLGGYETQEKFCKICSKFKIDEVMLKQNYNNLSGGEKTKINLAKL